MIQRNYFASMMVRTGAADAMISGYSRAFPMVLRPVFEVIGTAEGVQKAATMNVMLTSRGPLFLADTAINVDPTAEELAEIALMTANAVKDLGYKPTIAMLSHSNFGSSKKTQAVKVRQAVQMMHKYYPEIDIDGEVQSDFALNAEMTANDFPFSKLTGKKVNTLIFPNLDAANITYKLMKELHGVKSIGPIMLGLNHPVHILQLRASVDEIVNMATFAVVDAQKQTKA